jgi:hypothetical protein
VTQRWIEILRDIEIGIRGDRDRKGERELGTGRETETLNRNKRQGETEIGTVRETDE